MQTCWFLESLPAYASFLSNVNHNQERHVYFYHLPPLYVPFRWLLQPRNSPSFHIGNQKNRLLSPVRPPCRFLYPSPRIKKARCIHFCQWPPSILVYLASSIWLFFLMLQSLYTGDAPFPYLFILCSQHFVSQWRWREPWHGHGGAVKITCFATFRSFLLCQDVENPGVYL